MSGPPQVPELSRGHQIFNDWLRDMWNRPEVYWHFDRLALALIDAGLEHYGAKGITETMRYHTAIETRDETGVKCGNNFPAWNGRLWTLMHPEHVGFLRFRKMRSFDEAPHRKKWKLGAEPEWIDPKIDQKAPEANEVLRDAMRDLAKHLMEWLRNERERGAAAEVRAPDGGAARGG